VARAAQERHAKTDPWLAVIEKHVRGRDYVTVQQLLVECLNIQREKQTQLLSNRVVACLKRLGWRRGRRRIDGESARVYLPGG
jgi:hypothetical protein